MVLCLGQRCRISQTNKNNLFKEKRNMESIQVCSKCGNSSYKTGKIFGIASVHSLDSKVGIGGSDLLINFCDSCGTVESLIVKNPEEIK